MENRRIGSLTVSLVGLGCNNFGGRLDYERTAAVVGAALDAGITLLDTADIYGKTDSETFLGRALGARRNDIVLATKFGMAVDATRKGAKPDYVRRALDDSLRRLRTDRVDLYQLHEPDASTPIADTLGALDDLVNAGKIREIGCSNFSVPQLREARAAAGNGAKFVSVQNEFSLVQREPEREVLAECEREKLAFIPFFPLASGLLTGKYRRGQPAPAGARLSSAPDDARLRVVERLEAFARSHGHTMLELAMSWLACHGPVASVIAGASTPDQVRANVAAAGWKLTPAEMDEARRLADF
jgi:aryl-alcohol dehydrogenase-like predicted oxidoreductase